MTEADSSSVADATDCTPAAASSEADATAVAEVGHIDRQVRGMLLTICGVDDPGPQDISLMRLVQHTWHGILQSSLNGRISADETEDEIQLACRLILAPLSEAAS